MNTFHDIDYEIRHLGFANLQSCVEGGVLGELVQNNLVLVLPHFMFER